MTAIARAERYAGQDFPCYGTQPMVWGLATVFSPWFFDGKVVRWGPPCGSRSDAVAAAAEMASLATRAGAG